MRFAKATPFKGFGVKAVDIGVKELDGQWIEKT